VKVLLYLIPLICFLAVNIQCSKKMNRTDTNESMSAPALPVSVLNMQLSISKNELNATLNHLVNNLFSDGFTVEDGYKLQSRIAGLIDMQAVNNQIITTIPLQVDIIPGGILKHSKVKGIISVQLTTSVEIFQDRLLNKTELSSYQWINKPVMNMLGINLPIEPIANYLIKKYKSNICQSIDESIQKNFDLSKIRSAAGNFFSKPMYSTEDDIIHVYASPLQFAIGPMSMTPYDLQIPLSLSFESVISETKPQDLYNDPNFAIQPFAEDISHFNIQSRLPLPYIEQLLREQIENQTYGSGISSFTVKKIALHGQDKNLRIQLDLTGGYNGKMDLSFDPVYDKQAQKIELENFKLKTQGGIKLKKIIFSLMKGFAENKLENIVEEQINVNLTSYLNNIHQMLAGRELSPGIFMNGKLLEYDIRDIRFFNERMYFVISSTLNMNAVVRHIDTTKIILKKS
jgi:hypothetical protein